MRARAGCIAMVGAVAIACSGGPEGQQHQQPYALEASAGTYNDGSGLVGLALLATLRDRSGTGPRTAWTGTLSDGAGPLASVRYDAAGSGSYSALSWPSVAPAPGAYGLSLAPDGADGTGVSFTVASGLPLTVPQVALSPDATTLSWPAVAGAASYECRVSSGGAVQLSAFGTGTTCDVGALPPGAYQASVLACSADLAAIGASASQRPALPARFDVSEARLAFSAPSGGAVAFSAMAAGGALDYSGATPGLAVWLSISQSGGTATPVPWTVEVVGPGLPASAPLSVTYGANFPRMLFWSYDVPATAGVYSYTASSTAGTLAGTITVGTPQALGVPQGVGATAGSQGSATVGWTAVVGATSYLVSVYDHSTGTLAASAWLSAPPASFPNGSFASGSTYDVYVDATDADMLGGAVPTQVAVSENTFQPASLIVP